MVRNNKRRAFTIVELVIVIAVIAILAAVMIPTFGGIIKRANISADTQMAAAINTQIKMYLAEGKTIETEADLKNALTSDANFTEQLNPKSAKHGYHFWYNPENQEVKLLSNDEVLKAEKIDDYSNGETPDLGFAKSAPRSFAEGYYFLDMADKDSDNEIAAFFAVLENMSQDADAYKGALEELGKVKGDNKDLATKVLERINATAVMTDKGVFINSNTINFIYIPAPAAPAEGEESNYYLSHVVNHVNDPEATTFTANITGGVIEIPAHVKVAEGSLDGFGAITVKVDAENVTELANVLYAGAVDVTATVVLNDGVSYTVDGSIVINNSTEKEENVTLPCRNPVIDFVTQTSSDSKVVNTYIALDKIINDARHNKESLTLIAKDFAVDENADPDLPVYDGVIWSVAGATKGDETINAADAKVTVTRDGVVTFDDEFNADTVTFTAKAVAGGKTVDYTLNVVTLDKITTQFNNVEVTFAKENGEWTLTTNNNTQIVIGVATGENNTDIIANANFSGEYAYYYNGKPFTPSALGVDPKITITTTTPENAYFGISNLAFDFDLDVVRKLDGGVGEQTITLNVEEFNANHNDTLTVKIKDNTNVPYAVAIPSYKATELIDVFDANGNKTGEKSIVYRYRVGNDANTPLPITEIFTLKKGHTAANYTIFAFSALPSGDGYFSNKNLIAEYDLSKTTTLDFSQKYTASKNQTYYLVLGVKEWDMYGNLKVYAPLAANIVEITVVDKGINVTETAQFTTPTDQSKSIVLHNDLSDFAAQGSQYLTLNGGSIYGNYFKVDARQFYDTDAMKSGTGHSFIVMTNGSINQFILDGPVFPKQVLMSKDLLADTASVLGDGSVYFCHGIVVKGTKVTINDSYLSHFNAPLFVYSKTIEANNTVFEGGSLANVYIRSGVENVNFTNVMTVQNRTGYSTTLSGQSGSVLGMGIFIHEDQTTALNFNFVNVEQYNWLGSTDKIGTYTKMAIEEVYGKNYTRDSRVSGVETSVALVSEYSAFGHSTGEKVTEGTITGSTFSPKRVEVIVERQYVNASIAAINKTATITVTSKDAEGNIKYTYKGGDGSAESNGSSGTVWISTYAHNDACPCMDGAGEGIHFNYGGAETFRADAGTRFN